MERVYAFRVMKEKQGKEWRMMEKAAFSCRALGEGLCGEATSELRPEVSGELALWASGRRVFPARAESKDKGPEVGLSTAVGRTGEAATRWHGTWL